MKFYGNRPETTVKQRDLPTLRNASVSPKKGKKGGLRRAMSMAYQYKAKGLQVEKEVLETMSQKKHRMRKAQSWRESHQNWWDKPEVIAGAKSNPAQQRLCDERTFTGVYKPARPDEKPDVAGDYHHDKAETIELLLNSSYQDLTTPQRAADFRNEVSWRLSLRPGMHRGHGAISKLSRHHKVHLLEREPRPHEFDGLQQAATSTLRHAASEPRLRTAAASTRRRPLSQTNIFRNDPHHARPMIYEEPPSVMIGGGSSVRSASVIDEEEASQALNPVIRPHTQSKFARRLGQPDKDGYIRALPAATSPKRKRRGGARTQAGARGKGLRVSTSMGAMQHASVTFSPVALRHKLGSDARTSKGLTAGSLLQALEEASVGSLDMRPHREWDTSSLGSAESFEQITRIA